MQLTELLDQILFSRLLHLMAVAMVVIHQLAIPQVQAAMAALAAVRQGHLVGAQPQVALQHLGKAIMAVVQVMLVLAQRMAVVVAAALAQLVVRVI
jgi:hypothetical protein